MKLNQTQKKAKKWAEKWGYIIVKITDNFIIYKRGYGEMDRIKLLTDFDKKRKESG